VRLFSPGRCAPIDTGDVLRHGDAPVEAAAVKATTSGALVATGDDDGVLRLFQVSPAGVWQQRCEQQADVGPVNSIAIAPDGGLIAVAGGDSRAALLEAGEDDTCPLVHTLDGHTARVYTIAFSPDGAQLVTASLDKTARLWDRDGSPRAVLTGHQDRVYRATFSPGEGRWLLTASRDGSIRVWRRPKGPQTGEPIDLDAFLPLLADAGGVASAEFSPDGHYIAGAYWENAALLWRLWSERDDVPTTLAKRWGPDRARLTLLQEAYRFRDDTVLADLPETETETDIDQEQ
jgi:WD40 repeat protein